MLEIIIGCIIFALIVSSAIMLVIRSKLKSVRAETTACNYTRRGSSRLTASHDQFLFSRITKIPKAQQSGSGSRRR